LAESILVGWEIASPEKLHGVAEAGGVYVRIADQNPKAYSAILRLGCIALLSNRLADAQKWLEEWKRR
jgi:hypothetical protein